MNLEIIPLHSALNCTEKHKEADNKKRNKKSKNNLTFEEFLKESKKEQEKLIINK